MDTPQAHMAEEAKMSKNTRNTVSVSTLAVALENLAGAVGDLAQGQARLSADVEALLAGRTEPTKAPSKGTKARKASKAPEALTRVSMTDLRLRLKEHKAAGAIASGVSAKQALAEGLMLADGTLPGATKAPKKGKKAKKAKAPEGPSFKEVQARVREHKAAGLIAKGVTVREAQAAGLVDDEGNILGKGAKAPKTPKAGKKGKRAVAKVVADAPAKVRAADGPRRADGTITPQDQWELRERLALSGKFDRHEIDAIAEPERA